MKAVYLQGLAYLGEYPLSWAACLCNETVYNLLIESGADPDAQVGERKSLTNTNQEEVIF